MKQKKVNGVLKGAFAFGAALGGAGMITDMDIVYAEELKNESEASLDEEEFEEAATSEAASEAPEEEVNADSTQESDSESQLEESGTESDSATESESEIGRAHV